MKFGRYYLNKVSWFSRIDDRRAPNVKQYLRGLRRYQLLQRTSEKPYNYHLMWLSLIVAYVGTKYLKHALLSEFDQREE